MYQKVHITLEASILPEQRLLVLNNIVAMSGLHDVNHKRFARYGIISGVVEAIQIPRLQKMPEVKSVSVDQEQRAVANNQEPG